MDQTRKELNKRKIALAAFAKSVKKTGKIEWFMTVIVFLIFFGFFALFGIKYFKLPMWTLFAAAGVIILLGIYVGYEIYLSRIIRGNELQSFLEISSLLSHVSEKVERIELALVKELDIVIGIKKDVTKSEEEKREIADVTIDSVKSDIQKIVEENMVFKYCAFDDENVYVSKQMQLCPFCWNKLEEIEQTAEDAEEAELEPVQDVKINEEDAKDDPPSGDKDDDLMFD